jgi:hypothetical protein
MRKVCYFLLDASHLSGSLYEFLTINSYLTLQVPTTWTSQHFLCAVLTSTELSHIFQHLFSLFLTVCTQLRVSRSKTPCSFSTPNQYPRLVTVFKNFFKWYSSYNSNLNEYLFHFRKCDSAISWMTGESGFDSLHSRKVFSSLQRPEQRQSPPSILSKG